MASDVVAILCISMNDHMDRHRTEQARVLVEAQVLAHIYYADVDVDVDAGVAVGCTHFSVPDGVALALVLVHVHRRAVA